MGKISQFDIKKESAIQLAELGLVQGENIEMVQIAPLGDPLEIKVMNYHLCLRKEDAANILIQVDKSK